VADCQQVLGHLQPGEAPVWCVSSSAFLALADFWCAPFAEGSVQSSVRRRVVHLLACLHSEANVKCRLSCGQQAAAVGEAR